jgi:putative NIF3 family GTP cyclohydrolase 1 type 2
MKAYLTLLIVACQTVTALAQNDKTPYLTKALTSDAINSVVVTTSAGGIQVSGESGQAARIEVYIRGNNYQELSKQEIAKRLEEDYDMNIAVNGHELTATVKNKHNFSNWKRQMSISFKIYVPQAVSTNLKTSGGGISLDNLKGNETFSTSGGGLDINKVTGVIHGRTSGGGIDVKNSGDDIDLNTSGGGIEARNCNGNIRLVTSGGGLVLEELKGTIHARTSGGGIDGKNIEGELVTSTSGGGIDLRDLSCSLDAGTSAGDLRVEMKQVGKYLKLSASSGNIEMRLPLKQGLDLNISGDRINQRASQISGFTGDWSKNRINGSVNGGGIPVDAHASSGEVEVKFN